MREWGRELAGFILHLGIACWTGVLFICFGANTLTMLSAVICAAVLWMLVRAIARTFGSTAWWS